MQVTGFEVKNDHIKQVKEELERRIPVILEALGLEAQGNAITEITNMEAVDTGRLRNSITWATSKSQGSPNSQPGDKAGGDDYKKQTNPEDNVVYIGTNVEYAPYVELGTYKMPSRPFLKNAVEKYKDKYQEIVKEGLK